MFNVFGKKPRGYYTPGGDVYTLFEEMAAGNHLLIAGATGSGKSVLINGIMHTLLMQGPGKVQFILIDPKRVELGEYRDCPHCLYYGNTTEAMEKALRLATQIMEQRLTAMEQHRERKWTGSRLYVVIDELADLLTVPARKKACLPLLQSLLQTARAAGIVLICASQTAVATVIPTPLKANFADRVALRTACAQDSRNIIAQAGAEAFPDPVTEHKALCYWRHGANLDLYNVPTYPPEEHERVLKHWTTTKCIAA